MFDCLYRGGALKVDSASLHVSESDDSRAGRQATVGHWREEGGRERMAGEGRLAGGGGWPEGEVGGRGRLDPRGETRPSIGRERKMKKSIHVIFIAAIYSSVFSNPSQTITLQ